MSSVPKNSKTQKVLHEIDVFIRARYPILYIVSHEESRVELFLQEQAELQRKPIFSWTSSQGMRQLSTLSNLPRKEKELCDPIEVLEHISKVKSAGLFILRDFHSYMDDPVIVRWLRDHAEETKKTYKTIIVISPTINLPPSLEKDVCIVDFPLPDIQELANLLKRLCESLKNHQHFKVRLSESDFWMLVRSALGLTLSEAENAFSRAVVNDSVIDASDVDLILLEKKQIIRKSGVLDFFTSNVCLDEIGGLENLKEWLNLRRLSFSDEARKFGLPAPKGALLLGAPGCGKSLTAKAIAHSWKLPLLRLDFGKVFSGLVGSSEENIRSALKVAESIAPAILWIDELEKGLSGNSSGHSDGGTATRVFGTFLTWMQEKESFIFVVATANNVEQLPPELLRKGRFDEIFFVDLPDKQSRAEITNIHIARRGRDPGAFNLDQFIAVTEGFSGAEIEHCVTEGLFNAFSQSRELSDQDLLSAATETTPLSVTYFEELKRLKEWALTRTRSASKPKKISIPQQTIIPPFKGVKPAS